MKPVTDQEGGFTLIELMVAISIFSIVLIGFYTVMFSSVRGANKSESTIDVSGEARLGLNRLVRDTREAKSLRLPATATQYSIEVDFDRNGTIALDEVETFTYNSGPETITLAVDVNKDGVIGAGESETLIDGVTPLGATDIFSYSSNFLEFDQDIPRDGIADWDEVDTPPPGISGGDRSGPANTRTAAELPFMTNVDFVFEISSGEGDSARTEAFYGQAQLRNLR